MNKARPRSIGTLSVLSGLGKPHLYGVDALAALGNSTPSLSIH